MAQKCSLVLLYGCDLDCDPKWPTYGGGKQLGQDKVGVGKTHPLWVASAPSETPPCSCGRKGEGASSSPQAHSL